MMGMLEAAQCLSMNVDHPTTVQGIFHSWILPWFQPGWAHGAGLCPEPHWKWQSIPLDSLPGTLWQRNSHRATVSWEAQRAPRALGWLSPPSWGFQARPRGLWLLSVVVGGLTLLTGLLQLQGFGSSCLTPLFVSLVVQDEGGM